MKVANVELLLSNGIGLAKVHVQIQGENLTRQKILKDLINGCFYILETDTTKRHLDYSVESVPFLNGQVVIPNTIRFIGEGGTETVEPCLYNVLLIEFLIALEILEVQEITKEEKWQYLKTSCNDWVY